MTNYVEAKIDQMQENGRCTQCGDRDETINNIGKCRKLV